MSYVHADKAIARILGPIASGSLPITAGRGASFAAASPTAENPLALGVWRSPTPPALGALEPDGSEELIGAVLVTAVSGDSLTTAGAVPGYALPTLVSGDWIADAPIAAHLVGLVGPPGPKGDKGDTGDTGATGATGPAGPNTIAGLLSPPADGSIVLSGSGTPDSAFVPRAREEVLIGRWGTPVNSAGAVGDAERGVRWPYAVIPTRVEVEASANPTTLFTATVKAGSSTLCTLSLAAGAVGPSAVTSGFGVSPIPAGALILTTITGIAADARGVTISAFGRRA